MTVDPAPILERIEALMAEKERVLVAIDGRCGAGKSTLAAALQQRLSCPLIHMDDFFLRPEQRTPARLAESGGNIDHERFLTEVLRPLRAGERFAYRPFSCATFTLGEPVEVTPGPVTLIEGSYSCHPALRACYDLTVFLSVGREEQLARLRARGGDAAAETFRTRWIPLEERYFSAFAIAERSDILLET